ncbi:MAG: ISNCY family transposase [Candidatus Tisiphia sp.]|nr:ISNCY family transposase [Candidatus Tisiphia sp.]
MASKTKILQEVIKMRFEEIYDRYGRGEITNEVAADLLGCSERTFRRKKVRYEENGFSGLLDRRIGHMPPNKVAVDEVEQMLKLYEETYYDFTSKHFHEQLVKKHKFTHSYNFVRVSLQGCGLVAKLTNKEPHHRLKRPRKSMVGMMIHQDGSTHQWIYGLGYHPDLIVTMDDASNEIYSAFLIKEEGTASCFIALTEVIEAKGLFSSLYVDRGSHYAYTPTAGGKVDKNNPTQVGRACKQLGIQLIHAYSPEARGRSERMFGSLQKRLPQEFRVAGIKTIKEANCYLKEVFVPEYNEQFCVTPELKESAFIPYTGRDLQDILSIQEERVVAKDNTVSYNKRLLQIPSNAQRYHYVKCRVMIHEYTNGELAIFHGARKLAKYDASGKVIVELDKKVDSVSVAA